MKEEFVPIDTKEFYSLISSVIKDQSKIYALDKELNESHVLSPISFDSVKDLVYIDKNFDEQILNKILYFQIKQGPVHYLFNGEVVLKPNAYAINPKSDIHKFEKRKDYRVKLENNEMVCKIFDSEYEVSDFSISGFSIKVGLSSSLLSYSNDSLFSDIEFHSTKNNFIISDSRLVNRLELENALRLSFEISEIGELEEASIFRLLNSKISKN